MDPILASIDRAVRRRGKLDPDFEHELCWLYRYHDRDGVLLYVGVSSVPVGRAREHRNTSRWWRFADHVRLTWVPGRDLVLALEKAFVLEEDPIFNITHAPASREILAIEYAAHREAWDLVDELVAERVVVIPS